MAVDAARADDPLRRSPRTGPTRPSGPPTWTRECGGDAELRRRVEALLAAHDGAGRFLEGDATGDVRTDLTRNPGSDRGRPMRKRVCRRNWRPRKTDRTARTSRSPAPRRPTAPADPARARSSPAGTRCSKCSARGAWARLPGRADRTGQAAGGAEADQDRDGLAGGAGPVRRRAAGAGPDGPPQHRPRLRRRHHRGRPAVLRHGAGQRRADHRVLRPPAAAGAGPAGAVRRGLPGGAARPPEGDHPPRPQARQRAGHRGRRPADAEGHRLRRRQGDRIQAHRPEPRRHRGDRRHADVHVARAGRPVVDGHRHPDRRLCPRA